MKDAPTLHLIKLCVGIERVAELVARQKWQKKEYNRIAHITRMAPKRGAELLAGGSLYWVLKGVVRVRQTLTAIEPYKDDAGVGRVRLHLSPRMVAVRPTPRRPFQGWRYLPAADAPPDLSKAESAMPEALRAELADLGLL